MSFWGWFIVLGLFGAIFLRKPLAIHMREMGEEHVRNQLSGGTFAAIMCVIISLAEYIMREDTVAGWVWIFNVAGSFAAWSAILALVELGRRSGAAATSQMPASSKPDRSSSSSRTPASSASEIKLRVVQRTQREIPVQGTAQRGEPAGQQQRGQSGPALAAGSWEDILRRVQEAASTKKPAASAPPPLATPAATSAQPAAGSQETYPAPAFTFWHPEAEQGPAVDPATQAATAAAAASSARAQATVHREERQPERRRGVHDVADTSHHEGMKVELGVTRKIGEGAAASAGQARPQPVIATAGKSALPVRPPGPVRIGGSSLARPTGPVSLGGGRMARKPGPVSLGGGGMARAAGPLSLSAGQAHLAGPLSGTGRTGVVSRIGVAAAQHTPRSGTDVKRQESATGEQPDEVLEAAASVASEAKH